MALGLTAVWLYRATVRNEKRRKDEARALRWSRQAETAPQTDKAGGAADGGGPAAAPPLEAVVEEPPQGAAQPSSSPSTLAAVPAEGGKAERGPLVPAPPAAGDGVAGPSTRPNHVLLRAARTLNAAGPSRVTLSLR